MGLLPSIFGRKHLPSYPHSGTQWLSSTHTEEVAAVSEDGGFPWRGTGELVENRNADADAGELQVRDSPGAGLDPQTVFTVSSTNGLLQSAAV